MRGEVASQDIDGVQGHWPVQALAVIVGFTVGLLVLFNIAPNHIPLWVSWFAYETPLAMAAVLGLAIAKAPSHTRGNKRDLAKFFLACYLLAIGAFLLSMARSDYADSSNMGWGFAQGYLMIWLPVAVLLPALAAGLYVVSGASPWRRPLPYAAILLAATLIIVVLMPVPNSLTGRDVGSDTLGMRLDDNDQVLLVFPLWQYYLHTTSVGFIGIVIQLWAGIGVLGLGGMWSLARPESFRKAFAMHVEPTPATPPAPGIEENIRLNG
jgi:hypothetical protein